MPRAERRIYRPTTHTRVKVAFFTHSGNGPSQSEPFEADSNFGALVAMQTSKQMGAASGTWSLTVKKDPRFWGALTELGVWEEPEDVWVRIYVECDGQRFDTVLGIVDSISESTQRSGQGQRSETYTIQGRDIGKVLETTEVWVNLWGHQDQSFADVVALAEAAQDSSIGTPADILGKVLDVWLANTGAPNRQWEIPPGVGGRFAEDLITRQFQPMTEADNGSTAAVGLFQLDQSGGKLWDILKEYSNELLNELYIDLGYAGPVEAGEGERDALASLTPQIVLREKPFVVYSDVGTADTSAWDALRTRTLEPADVQKRQLAKGNAGGRFNYWQLQAEGIGTDAFTIDQITQSSVAGAGRPGYPGDLPIYNRVGIRRHGVRRYIARTRYLPYYASNSTTVPSSNEIQMAAAWLKKVHDWHAPNPREITGTIQTSRIMPEIRIGQRLIDKRPWGDVAFYVEGVAHTWSYPGVGSTTITVTRGARVPSGGATSHLRPEAGATQAGLFLGSHASNLAAVYAEYDQVATGALPASTNLPTTVTDPDAALAAPGDPGAAPGIADPGLFPSASNIG